MTMDMFQVNPCRGASGPAGNIAVKPSAAQVTKTDINALRGVGMYGWTQQSRRSTGRISSQRDEWSSAVAAN